MRSLFFVFALILCPVSATVMGVMGGLIVPQFAAAQTTSAQTNTPPLANVPEGVEPVRFPAVIMVMTTPAGEFPMFLELALTPEQAQRGLMYRPDLPDDYGMLFVFANDSPRSFWMKNTLSPLDIVYIRSDGVVDSIQQGTPLSEQSLPSAGPAKFVLEVRQGLAETYGLVPGATINFK